MQKMMRKSMLYKTQVEYGDYTMNHVQGCSHGCKYPCYAFLIAKRFGKVKTYEDWCQPVLVDNTLELLDREIPRLKHKIQSVQLCFTTDPFMYGYPEVETMSLAAIQRLDAAGIPVTALTKGLLPIELADTSARNSFGITLVSLDEGYRERIEPGAAPYEDRIAALRALHDAGRKTWVSMEPYPTPNIVEQDISKILEAVSFTDRIIFGRTNYNTEVSAYKRHRDFYNDQAAIVVDFCVERGIDYYLKQGTVTPALTG